MWGGSGGVGGCGGGACSNSMRFSTVGTASTVTPSIDERALLEVVLSVLAAASASAGDERMSTAVTVTLAALTVSVTPSAAGKAASRLVVKATRSKDSTVPETRKAARTTGAYMEPGRAGRGG